MAEIFLSYDRADRPVAEALSFALQARGWSTWWDQDIPAGETWAGFIKQQLDEARCVAVLWSTNSVDSNWVSKEARYAARKGILVPARIEDVEPPFEFEEFQAANLVDWDGGETEGFEQFVEGIGKHLSPGEPLEPELSTQTNDAPESGATGQAGSTPRRGHRRYAYVAAGLAATVAIALWAVIDTSESESPPTPDVLGDSLIIDAGGQLRLATQTADSSAAIVWSTSDESVASVSLNGVLTAHRRGIADLVAHSGDLVDTVSMMVFPSPQAVPIDYTGFGTYLIKPGDRVVLPFVHELEGPGAECEIGCFNDLSSCDVRCTPPGAGGGIPAFGREYPGYSWATFFSDHIQEADASYAISLVSSQRELLRVDLQPYSRKVTRNPKGLRPGDLLTMANGDYFIVGECREDRQLTLWLWLRGTEGDTLLQGTQGFYEVGSYSKFYLWRSDETVTYHLRVDSIEKDSLGCAVDLSVWG